MTSSRRAVLIGGAAAFASLVAPTGTEPAAAQPHAAVPTPPMRPLPRRPLVATPLPPGDPTTLDESAAMTVPTSAAAVPTGQQYKTFSAAAKAATPIPSVFDGGSAKSHLLRRATFGQRVGDVNDLTKLGIDGWLNRQLNPSKIKDPDGDAVWKAFPLAGAPVKTILAKSKDYSWDAMMDTTYAQLGKQVFSKRQLFEITVDIFANTLHVPLPGEQWATSPGFIKNVIRKYAFGKYANMLKAAMRHPAMLNYLNNDESRKKKVNENLGRELLELHTVGIGSGYTEEDVLNSARILSGRSWEGWLERRRSTYGKYVYNAADHYVGPVKVLGFSHKNATAEGGQAVGSAYLDYLARHPATAEKIARKIATRFVSDQPSDDLVNRLAKVYLKHDTNIREVVRAVFLSSDFWSATGTRMRRPLEDGVGTARVLSIKRGSKPRKALQNLHWSLSQAGQTAHGWLPPNGYPDVAAAWLGGGAMIQRWNVHRMFVWWGYEFTWTQPHKLVTQTPTMTAEQWLTKVVKRLVGVPMSPEHFAAILEGSGLKPGDLMVKNHWKSGRAVALVLDSPYFQLR